MSIVLISSSLLVGAKEAFNYYLSRGKKPEKEVQDNIKSLAKDFLNDEIKIISHSGIGRNQGIFQSYFAGNGLIVPEKLPKDSRQRTFSILQNLTYLRLSQFELSKVAKLVGPVALISLVSMAVYSIFLPSVLVKVLTVTTGFFAKEIFFHGNIMSKIDKRILKKLSTNIQRYIPLLEEKLYQQKMFRNQKKLSSFQSHWRTFVIDKEGNYRLNTLVGVSLSERIKKLKTLSS